MIRLFWYGDYTTHKRLAEGLHLLHQLIRKVDTIMATQAELAEDLRTQAAKIDKIGTETDGLKASIADLEQALLNAGNTTPEVDAAMADVKSRLQAVDDKVTDATG